jgi:hypothetical protein
MEGSGSKFPRVACFSRKSEITTLEIAAEKERGRVKAKGPHDSPLLRL